MNRECALITVVVNSGKASRVVKYAKQKGISGATILLGKGSADNKILKFFELSETRKEIIFMIIHYSYAQTVLEALKEKFHFDKPNHGIAFTMLLDKVLGLHQINRLKENKIINGGVSDKMFKAIFTVVDRGKAEAVMDSAKFAGAKGGTIINGRGTGIHEHQTLFSFPIDPEKEIVMIISEEKESQQIINRIRQDLKIDEPGKGIMFVLDVNQVYGL